MCLRTDVHDFQNASHKSSQVVTQRLLPLLAPRRFRFVPPWEIEQRSPLVLRPCIVPSSPPLWPGRQRVHRRTHHRLPHPLLRLPPIPPLCSRQGLFLSSLILIARVGVRPARLPRVAIEIKRLPAGVIHTPCPQSLRREGRKIWRTEGRMDGWKGGE